MSDLLTLENISGGYRHHRVLNALNLTISTGEVVAVVGENGVGKTTLLKAIMGLVRIDEGDKRFTNKSILRLTPDAIARQGIAYVPQTQSVFGELTIAEHFKLLGVRNIETYLSAFPDLLPKQRQQAKKLSGGQRQQLAIAFALAKKPKLLLLDEPTANIQPSIIGSMIAVLQHQHQENQLTLLFTEQNLAVVNKLAKRVVKMQKGQLS